MPQNKKTTHSLLFILSFEEGTLLYFLDGSIEIYPISIHRFFKQHQAIYLSKVYRQPMLLFGIVFLPSSSPRNKDCVWINTEFFKLDTMLYHYTYISNYSYFFILEKMYVAYVTVMKELQKRDTP